MPQTLFEYFAVFFAAFSFVVIVDIEMDLISNITKDSLLCSDYFAKAG